VRPPREPKPAADFPANLFALWRQMIRIFLEAQQRAGYNE
jgi:hypothetical protein